MNKNFSKLIPLGLIALLGFSFLVQVARAEGGLGLEVIKECDIEYAGDSCVAKLKLFNKTGKVLDGKASLHINYQGICSNNKLVDFDGEGIEAQFSINSGDWLNFTGWKNGTTTVSGFNIAKGETHPNLKIRTLPNLCPGAYIFTLTIKGTADGEEYSSLPVAIGGGGSGTVPGLTITYEQGLNIGDNTALIIWLTSHQSTSRVVYGTEAGVFDLTNLPNYGYQYSSSEEDTPANENGVTFHEIELTGLIPNTTYYFRCISHASPPTISQEHSFTTSGEKEAGAENEEDKEVIERITEIPGRIIEGIEGFIERVIPSAPITEEEPSAPEEAGSSEEAGPPEEEPSQRGLASIAAAIGNLVSLGTGSVSLGIIVLLIALGIVLLVIRGIRLSKKSKLN